MIAKEDNCKVNCVTEQTKRCRQSVTPVFQEETNMYIDIPREPFPCDDPSVINIRQKLFPEEEKMPLAKYFYNYPLHYPTPLEMQIINNMNPIDPADVIQPQNFLDLLKPYGYDKVELGYCMFPDGSGYVATYRVRPASITGEMERWYRNWRNLKSKSMIPSHGNLRYKIWNPLEHWDHHFVNGDNDRDGVWSLETLKMTEGTDPRTGIPAISHNLDLLEYGLTEEKKKTLEDAGCRADACWEEFDGPGHHLVLRFSRPCPTGGRESFNCEWLGYYAKNGQIIRDADTPVSEKLLRAILIHNTVEREHLLEVLPDLYAAYHDQPLDAD